MLSPQKLIHICLGVGIGIAGCSLPTELVASSVDVDRETGVPSSPSSILAHSDPSPTQDLSQAAASGADWARAEVAQVLRGHRQPITAMVFSPDGERFASSDDQTILLWQTQTGQSGATLPGHPAIAGNYPTPITSLTFSPDGTQLASSSWSQGLRPAQSIILWDTQTGKKIRSLGGSEGCRQVLFSPDGQSLIGACGGGVRVWSAQTGQQRLRFYQRPVAAIALSADGKTLATVDLNASGGQLGEDAQSIRLWRLTPTGATPLRSLQGHQDDIHQIAFTPDGQRLVSGSFDRTVKVWDWQRGRVSSTLSGYNLSPENPVSFSLGAGGQLIAGEFNNTLLRNLKTGATLNTTPLFVQQGPATALALSSQGQTLAWAGKPPTYPQPIIRLWQVSASGAIKRSNSDRTGYAPVPLSSLLPEASIPEGPTPKAVVLSLLGFSELRESQKQQIEVSYPSADRAVVILTQTGLLDDSVAGLRYRAELVSDGSSWRLSWVGRQQKCRARRGHQDWSPEPCI